MGGTQKVVRLSWREARPHFEDFDNIAFLEWGMTHSNMEAWQLDDELCIILRPNGQEAHYVASSGRNLNKHIPLIMSTLKSKGYTSIRYHCHAVEEKAVIRLVRKHGAVMEEIIFRKEL